MDIIVASVVRLLRVKSIFSTSAEALQACACVTYVLSSFGNILREVQQQRMARILSTELTKEKDSSELAQLAMLRVLVGVILEIGEAGSEMPDWLHSSLTGLLQSQYSTVRAHSAACLRGLSHALPANLAPLIRTFIEKTEQVKLPSGSNQELTQNIVSIRGFSAALSALIAEVPRTPLGVPDSVVQATLKLAQNLREANQGDQRMHDARSESTWRIISSLISVMGSSFVKSLAWQILSLVATSLSGPPAAPRTQVDIPGYVQAKLGPLWALTALAETFPDLLNDKGIQLIQQPLIDLVNVVSTFTTCSSDYVSLLALNVFRAFVSIQNPKIYTSCFQPLVKLILAYIQDGPAASLLRSLLCQDDAVLGPWPDIDDDLAELSGIFAHELQDATLLWNSNRDLTSKQPLPLGVQAVDAAIKLLSSIAIQTDIKRITPHLENLLKSKNPGAQSALPANVLTTFVALTKSANEKRVALASETLSQITNCANAFIGDADPALRRGSGEIFGLLCRLGGDSFTASLVQSVTKAIKSAKEDTQLAGFSFSLACILRYVGGMRASQFLPVFVPLLHSLALKPTNMLHTWAMHSLCAAVDATGPSYPIDQTLGVIKAMFQSPAHMSSMTSIRGIGRIMNSIVGAVGPELRPDSQIFKICTVVLSDSKFYPHPLVQLESILFYQRLILFAPQAVNPATFTPLLQQQLSSPYLVVRQAAVTCFRQLVQAKQAWDLGVPVIQLAKQLFAMLDSESDRKLLAEGELVLSSMIEVLSPTAPAQWLSLLKDIVLTTHATTKERVVRMESAGMEASDQPTEGQDGQEEPEPEAEVQPQSMISEDEMKEMTGPQNELVPRWRTKVFAIECLCKLLSIIRSLPNSDAHFDLIIATSKQGIDKEESAGHLAAGEALTSGNWLVFGLPDLVKVMHFAATNSIEPLRPAGVKLMLQVVKYFANARDPQMEDHSLLEIHQVQFTSGLNRAFTPDAPPAATAAASEVLVGFVTAGVCSDAGVVKRLLSLITQRIDNITSLSYQMYSERAATMVQLALISALAHLHLLGSNRLGHAQADVRATLTQILEPFMPSLCEYWLNVLRDYAVLVTQPATSQGIQGSFFSLNTAAEVKNYYQLAWVYVLRAAASLFGTKFLPVENEKTIESVDIMLGLLMPILRELHQPDMAVHCMKALSDLVAVAPFNWPKEKRIPLCTYEVLLDILVSCRRHIESGNAKVQAPAVELVLNVTKALPSNFFEEAGNQDICDNVFYHLLELAMYHTRRGKPGSATSASATPTASVLCLTFDAISSITALMTPTKRLHYLPTILLAILNTIKSATDMNEDAAAAALKAIAILISFPKTSSEAPDFSPEWESTFFF